MPFAQYDSFDDCVSKNQDKDNPAAYCAAIKAKTESNKAAKHVIVEYLVPIEINEKTIGNTTSTNALPIKGTAIKVTTSKNGVRYLAEELQKAAPTFKGRPILKDHDARMESVVGRVTNSWFVPETSSIEFDGLIMDQKMQEMIKDGRAQEISIRASVDSIEEEDLNGDVKPTARGMCGEEVSFVVIPGVDGATIHNSFDGAICEAFQKLKVKTEMIEKIETKSIEKKFETPKVKEEEKPEEKPLEEPKKEQVSIEDEMADMHEKMDEMLAAMKELLMAVKPVQPAAEKKEEKSSESSKEINIVGEAAPLTKVEEKLPEKNKLVEQYQTPSGRTEYMFKHDYSKYKR